MRRLDCPIIFYLIFGLILIFANQARTETGSSVPAFVSSVPAGHFAGISSPMDSLAEARKSALNDMILQVLRSVSNQVDYQYLDSIFGDPRFPNRKINDRLSIVAQGIVLGVEQNIVDHRWHRDRMGRYVSYVLVHYPSEQIEEMHRLTRGAHVTASVVGIDSNELIVLVSEVNGVEAVLSSADIIIRKKNTFAHFISFHIWQVPAESEKRFFRAVGPITIRAGSAMIKIPLSDTGKDFVDYLLGARIQTTAVIKGHDEIGRRVEVNTQF